MSQQGSPLECKGGVLASGKFGVVKISGGDPTQEIKLIPGGEEAHQT